MELAGFKRVLKSLSGEAKTVPTSGVGACVKKYVSVAIMQFEMS